MERLNKSGRILIQYRDEYNRHYADSVDKALKEAIKTLYDERKIDEKVFRNIFNDDMTDEEFEIMLLKKPQFTKNKDELNYEFNQTRKKINEYMISIGFVKNMTTKNAIDMNKIMIIRQFDLDRGFLMSFMGVSQSELIPLMKRRGFIEKFSVLRLNKVMNEIFAEMKVPEDIDHGYSLVYYNKLTKSFSIDYKFNINVDMIVDEEKMKVLIDKIKELEKVVERKFQNKMGIMYFNNAYRSNMIEQQKDEIVQSQPNKKEQKTQIQPPKQIIESAQNPKAENKQIPQNQAKQPKHQEMTNKNDVKATSSQSGDTIKQQIPPEVSHVQQDKQNQRVPKDIKPPEPKQNLYNVEKKESQKPQEIKVSTTEPVVESKKEVTLNTGVLEINFDIDGEEE